jgi:YegS/Rv2252/BmrU family lipid kinase
VVSGVEIGILPLGTANDFARGCGLPVDDLTECLKIACTEKSRPMDVGRMNKHFFINVASLGFGAEVTATTPQDLKSKLGGAAYTLMGLATALKFKPYPCQLTIPGKPPLAGEMLIGAVGNSRFAGGGFEVAPAARLDDGLLDVAFLAKDAEFSLTKVISELKDPFNAGNR